MCHFAWFLTPKYRDTYHVIGSSSIQIKGRHVENIVAHSGLVGDGGRVATRWVKALEPGNLVVDVTNKDPQTRVTVAAASHPL